MAEVTSEGMRFVDNYRGSTLVRARWAEPPGGELYQEFGCQTPRLGEIQAVTQFSKAKVEKLYVQKVNVHIRIMYRRLGEIFSDFQKSPWKKWRFRLQRPFAPYHTIFERLTDFSTTILRQLFRLSSLFIRRWCGVEISGGCEVKTLEVERTTVGMKNWQTRATVSWRCPSGRCWGDQEERGLREYQWCPASC